MWNFFEHFCTHFLDTCHLATQYIFFVMFYAVIFMFLTLIFIVLVALIFDIW